MPERGERSSLVKTRCGLGALVFEEGESDAVLAESFFAEGAPRGLRGARKGALRRARKDRKKDTRKRAEWTAAAREFEAEIMGEYNPGKL